MDESGNKTKTYRYDAFGVEKNSDDADENPFRYCGEYFDKETNTIYLRARYYDPSIGRFITRDTYTGNGQDPLSLNLYTYCRNNPIIFTDESGHVFNLAAAAVGAAIGAAINVGVMAIGDAISGETHTAAEYAATAAAGAIGGLAAGFTLGGSVVAQVAGEIAIDAALGATSSVVEQAIVKKEVNWSDVGMSALSSGLCTGVNIGARRAVSNITPFCIGGAASKGCFTAGTLVETIDGDKPIETVQTGDYVLSSDPETGKTAYKEVVNTFVHVKETLVYITIDDEVIETTEEHPFWVEGQGWTNAKNLNAGDIVRDKNGNNLTIENVEIVKLPENEYIAVYNFEVAEYHTYYVSEFDVLVHNRCHHELDASVERNNIEIFRKHYTSGFGGGTGKLSRKQQAFSHTERLFLSDVENIVKPFDRIKMSGTLNPCNRGVCCQSAIRDFVQSNNVIATYTTGITEYKWSVQSFYGQNGQKIKGTILQEEFDSNGALKARYRYWKKGENWKRAKY